MSSTFKTRILVAKADAEAIATLIAEMLDPDTVVGVADAGENSAVEVYFSEAPEPDVFEAVAEIFPQYQELRVVKAEAVVEEDWVALVQRGLHPITAGRFLIHGSHDKESGRGRPFAIEVDAGQAFGTAHHGTTRGCLLAIDRLAKVFDIDTILDLGTGSGVLAIAAAKVFHREVVATDIDPVAVRVARENFAANGVASFIDAFVATGLKHPGIAARAPYGLVIANILAKPLLTFAPNIAPLMSQDGFLILSGMLHHQAKQVRARYAAQGFTLLSYIPLDEWTTLVMQYRG
jgi:ribosomal protein L11 methyltransferase